MPAKQRNRELSLAFVRPFLGLPLGHFRTRLASGMRWNLLVALSTQGATFLTNIVLSNLAGIKAFGRYAMIQNTLVGIAGLSSLSMSFTTAKYVSEFRSTDPNRAAGLLGMCSKVAFCAGGTTAVALMLLATPLATNALGDPALAFGMRLGVAFLFFNTINSYQLGALSGLEAYKSLGAAAAASAVIAVSITAAGAAWFGVEGAILGQSLSSLCRYGIHRRLLNSRCQVAGIFRRDHSSVDNKRIFSTFVLPAALSAYLTVPSIWFANTMLYRQPNGQSQLALYTAALIFKTILLFLPNAMTGVSLSVINNAKSTEDQSAYIRLYGYNIALIVGALVACAIPLMIFGQTLLRAFGRDFSGAGTVLQILTLSAIADGLATAAYPLVQSQGKMWLAFWAIALPRDAMFALLAYLWVPAGGALGLAHAQLAVSLLVAISTSAVCYTIMRGLRRHPSLPAAICS